MFTDMNKVESSNKLMDSLDDIQMVQGTMLQNLVL